jgi:hypothetical protein
MFSGLGCSIVILPLFSASVMQTFVQFPILILIKLQKMVSTYTATLERKITEIFEHLEADPKRALKVV